MRLVVGHLRMRVDQSHANFRDNLDWIYADKLEREAENLDRYCQQLARELSEALVALSPTREQDDAVRDIRRVRDTLAGKPLVIK